MHSIRGNIRVPHLKPTNHVINRMPFLNGVHASFCPQWARETKRTLPPNECQAIRSSGRTPLRSLSISGHYGNRQPILPPAVKWNSLP